MLIVFNYDFFLRLKKLNVKYIDLLALISEWEFEENDNLDSIGVEKIIQLLVKDIKGNDTLIVSVAEFEIIKNIKHPGNIFISKKETKKILSDFMRKTIQNTEYSDNSKEFENIEEITNHIVKNCLS